MWQADFKDPDFLQKMKFIGFRWKSLKSAKGWSYFEISSQLLTLRKDLVVYGTIYHFVLPKRQPQRKSWWGVQGVKKPPAKGGKKNFWNDVGHLTALGNICRSLLKTEKREKRDEETERWRDIRDEERSRAPGIRTLLLLYLYSFISFYPTLYLYNFVPT